MDGSLLSVANTGILQKYKTHKNINIELGVTRFIKSFGKLILKSTPSEIAEAKLKIAEYFAFDIMWSEIWRKHFSLSNCMFLSL